MSNQEKIAMAAARASEIRGALIQRRGPAYTNLVFELSSQSNTVKMLQGMLPPQVMECLEAMLRRSFNAIVDEAIALMPTVIPGTWANFTPAQIRERKLNEFIDDVEMVGRETLVSLQPEKEPPNDSPQ